MLTVIIWWSGLILGALIVCRGLCGKMIRKYPLFYVQMSFMLLLDLPCYIAYVIRPTFHYEMYWIIQFTTMFIACGIILEILNHLFSPYPVVRNFAKAMRFILGFVILGFGIAYLAFPQAWRVDAANVHFERDFRAVQSVFLLVILGVVFYYGLPIGRNIKGMFLGYGVCVWASLVISAIESYAGSRLAATWYFLQPLAYVISLTIWLATLWTYHPNPVPRTEIELALYRETSAPRMRFLMSAMST